MTSMGLRAAESLRQTMSALRMLLVPELVGIPLRQRLQADGHLDPDPSMTSGARALLDALARLTGVSSSSRASDIVSSGPSAPPSTTRPLTVSLYAWLGYRRVAPSPSLTA